jgi:acetyl esterase/lipase
MPNNRYSATALVLIVLSSQPAWSDDTGLLRTTYALDEARGYCLDIPGFGDTARIDAPLQVHTCKYGAALEDQIFARTGDGHRIALPEYERCLSAAALEPGATLHASACADTPSQRWRFEWGRLSPESRPDLCVSLADGSGEIAGTPVLIAPVYRRRDVSLERCSESLEARQSLRFSPADERHLSTADVVRSGWPAEVEERIGAFGHRFDARIAAETARIVAPVSTTYDAAEIEVIEGLAYGSHERQVLDIHTATARNSGEPAPVIVAFHGGGLVGGNKESMTAAASYFASLGYVGVKSSYRLAPDFAWPAGARDVGAAVTWLRDHVADYGGDPEQIFVLGLSSGSLHAATYVFRSDLMPAGTARAAGAILMSGPYTFDFEHPSTGELAYFGRDASSYASRVVVGNVSSTDIPVLFTTAEWDAPRYTRAFAMLLRELVVEHDVMPRYAQSLGHNHSSQVLAIGTADTSVSAEIVDFVERASGEGR